MIKTQILFICLWPVLLFGQHPYFQNIGSNNGLESDYVYCVYQDSKGYMWFGTDLGASRFDGYAFENYDAEDGMTGNEIFQIFEDSQSRIWFLSLNGELSYWKSGEFYNSGNDSLLSGFSSLSYLTGFLEEADGKIYITSYDDGLFILDEDEITHLNIEDALTGIWSTADGEIMVLTPGGVYVLKNNELKKQYGFRTYGVYPRGTVVNDTAYFGFGRDIIEYSGSNVKLGRIPDNAAINWMGHGQNNSVFIGTQKGLYTYSLDSDSLYADVHLQSSNVSYTLIDREGNLWVTTLGDGIFISTSLGIKIYNSNGAIPVDQITCLKKGFDNDLWVGMRRGHYAHLKNGVIESFQIKNHKNQKVTNIELADNNQLFISTKNSVLVKKGDTDTYFCHLANDLLVDSQYVYLASKELFRVPRDFFFDNLFDEPWTRGSDFDRNMIDYVIMRVNSSVITKDDSGALYSGTQKGLYKNEGGRLISLGENDVKLSSAVNDLCFDESRNLLYVATSSHGLVVLKDDNILVSFDKRNGLSGNNCQSLFLDEDGVLWVGTSGSLDQIAASSGELQIMNYGGFINLMATKISDIEKISEILYLATDGGLIEIDTKEQQSTLKTLAPIIHLSSLSVNSISRTIPQHEISLRHFENSIGFSYVGLSYKNIGNLTYKYKLEGHHEGWRTTKNTNVVYEALESGNYAFHVKAMGPNHLESETKRIQFSIERPLWRKSWFLVLVISTFILAVILVWMVRIRRIKRHFELEKRLVAGELEKLEMEKAYLLAELKAGVLQMNPHFLFNSLNTIKGYYAQNRFQEANRFISRFSKLLRLILECNTQLIPLHKEIEILSLYLELMQKRYDDVFEFKIDCLIPEIEKIKLPPMMLQPIVENAVIHGLAPQSNGKVEITFTQKGGCLICTVVDDGVGFYKSNKQLHQSVGIKNIRDRMDLLSEQFKAECSIQIESPIPNTEKGTLIRLQFPIKFADYLIK